MRQNAVLSFLLLLVPIALLLLSISLLTLLLSFYVHLSAVSLQCRYRAERQLLFLVAKSPRLVGGHGKVGVEVLFLLYFAHFNPGHDSIVAVVLVSMSPSVLTGGARSCSSIALPLSCHFPRPVWVHSTIEALFIITLSEGANSVLGEGKEGMRKIPPTAHTHTPTHTEESKQTPSGPLLHSMLAF